MASIDPPSPLVSTNGGTLTLLLAEDEERVRKLTRMILESGGYDVIEAADGLEALEIAEDPNRPIDLVVTDVVMPNLGGPEFVEKLRARRGNVPALFISGYPRRPYSSSPQPPLRGAFLDKPFTAKDLLGAVEKLLAEEGHSP